MTRILIGWARTLTLALTAAATVACGSSPSTRTADGMSPRRATPDDMPLRLIGISDGDAPELTSLPPVARFAFVPPSSAFRGVTSKEDSAAMRAAAGLREDASAVLRANGWREASADSAEFLLSAAVIVVTGERVTMVPDPRNERRPPQTCPRGVYDVRNPCREPAPPRYPPTRRVDLYSLRMSAYSIRRRADGATRWWALERMGEDEAGRFVARETLALLLAVEKQPY